MGKIVFSIAWNIRQIEKCQRPVAKSLADDRLSIGKIGEDTTKKVGKEARDPSLVFTVCNRIGNALSLMTLLVIIFCVGSIWYHATQISFGLGRYKGKRLWRCWQWVRDSGRGREGADFLFLLQKRIIFCLGGRKWESVKCSESCLEKYCVQYFQLLFWQQAPKINLPRAFQTTEHWVSPISTFSYLIRR